MINISVVLITLNEGDNIEGFVSSVSSLTDDIVIVDAMSTDDTVNRAEKFDQVTVISHPWEGFANARNKGANIAKYDWILAMDADERLSEELKQEISNLDFNDPRDIYAFSFINYIGGTAIRYGSWSGVWAKRIYNKNYSSWNGDFVHEGLEFSGKVHKLSGIFHHFSYRNLKHLEEKTDRYALLAGKKLFNSGRQYNFLIHFISPVWRFFGDYIVKRGFMDGKLGLYIAANNSRLVFNKYRHLKQLSQKKK